MFSRTSLHLTLFTSLFLSTIGCKPSGDFTPTVPASGVLQFNGQPLPDHLVIFNIDGGRSATGHSGPDGRFVLGTNTEGDGAMAGTHKVSVTYVGPPPDLHSGSDLPPELPPPKFKISSKYEDPETANLTFEVPPSGTSDLVIDLKPGGAGTIAPPRGK